MAKQQAVNAVRYSSELAFDSSVTTDKLKLTDSMSTRSNLFTSGRPADQPTPADGLFYLAAGRLCRDCRSEWIRWALCSI